MPPKITLPQQKALIDTMTRYKQAGLDVIPVDSERKFPPYPGWQEEVFTIEFITSEIKKGHTGIALRNMECLDFENKNGAIARDNLTTFRNILKDLNPDLLTKLIIETTRSGGVHIGWKCDHKTAKERIVRDNVLIVEKLGIGNQFLIAPTPGYKLVKEQDWVNAPLISAPERSLLLFAAQQLGDRQSDTSELPILTPVAEKTPDQMRPGDYYDATPALANRTLELLLEAGWQIHHRHNDTIHLTRPGKEVKEGSSATLNYIAPNWLHVFSSDPHTAPFADTEYRGYSPFHVYTLLKHAGDWRAATQAIIPLLTDLGIMPATYKVDASHLKASTLAQAQADTQPPDPATPPEDYEIVHGDVLLTEKLPKTHWLINRIIPAQGFTMMVAAEGSWKTFLTLSLAQSIASGREWLDNPEFRVMTPGKILFLDKENAMPLIQERIQGLGFTPQVAANCYWVKYPDKLTLTENNQVSAFLTYLSKFVTQNQISMIVVDSMVDFVEGSENSSQDTQLFFDALRGVFGHVAVLALHHENKPNKEMRNSAQRTRGSTNINAQAVVMFRVQALTDASGVNSDDVIIEQTKSRITQKLPTFKAKVLLESVTDEYGLANTVVKGFTYVGEYTSGKQLLDNTLIAIADVLSAGSMSRPEIVKAMAGADFSQSMVAKALKIGEDEQRWFSIKEKNTLVYTLMSTVDPHEQVAELLPQPVAQKKGKRIQKKLQQKVKMKV